MLENSKITLPELHYGDILEFTITDNSKEISQVVQGENYVYLVDLNSGVWVMKCQSLEGLNRLLPTRLATENILEVKHIPANKAQITISELPEGNTTVVVTKDN